MNTGTPKERAPSMRSPLLPLRGYRATARRLSFVAAAGLFCGAVLADDVQRFSLSTITLRPTTEDGAYAEVIFDNYDGDENTTIDSTFRIEGLEIDVRGIMGNGSSLIPDTILIAVPSGWRADPETLTVADGSQGRSLIYSHDSAGM